MSRRGRWPLFSTSVQNELANALTEEAVKTIVSAMNTLPGDLLSYVMAYTPIGATARQKNAMTSGAYVVEVPEVLALDGEGMEVSVGIRTRSFFGKVQESKETVRVSFETSQPFVTAEAVKRRLMEMSRAQGRTKSTATIYKIPVGSYGGLPPNMLLNNVPHSKLARNFIYRGAADALVEAVQDPGVSRRLKLVCTVPELNPAMDTYRIGTLLELVRELAYALADVGLNTRILIQPSMGEGIFKSLPLALSGVMNIMQGMDWEEGLVGEHVNFGALGDKSDVSAGDDVILVISPQNIAGYSVHQLLVDTVEEAAGRTVVIINPNLKDRPSSGGVMQVRGRGERISFAQSFKDVYNFRLLYASSVAFFPIKGAVMKSGPLEPYVVFARHNEGEGRGERYNPLATFDDDPDGENITPLFGRGDQ